MSGLSLGDERRPVANDTCPSATSTFIVTSVGRASDAGDRCNLWNEAMQHLGRTREHRACRCKQGEFKGTGPVRSHARSEPSPL